MPTSRRPANNALLCEHCGYDLAGLTRNDNCPECGKPITESLPANRTGTPWQRGASGAWRRSAWMVMVHPRGFWDFVRNQDSNNDHLIIENSLIGGALFLPCFISVGLSRDIILVGVDGQPGLDTWANAAGMIAVFWFISTLIGSITIWLLTAIEAFGIAHFGRRRGWRTDRVLARTICAHAGVMWVFAGVLGGLGLAIDQFYFGWIPWGMVTGLLLGMLLFETWVYLGFRAMRYANPPGAERHLRDHAGEANISTEPESARRM